MSVAARTCNACGGILGPWSFDICVGCLLRAGVEGTAPLDAPPDSPRLDGYRIVERIARSGMADVYLAEQNEPRRFVAIKMIRDDLGSARMLERFRYELEALAAMEHPGIAKIYEAAQLPDGRPYFVMEYVEGSAITAFAARRGLTIAERIDLFLEVCDAVRHAHQRGVIHRDLKPSNILVTADGGQSRPVLIDFGISRALGERRKGMTLAGEVVGTPAYMSPEQTIPGATVDTRTDTFGLGVVLYELLAGSVPDPELAEEHLPIDVQFTRIRELDPPAPSVRSGNRSLRGDLDAIVVQAIARQPSRRYESVERLADDLRRHLHSEPVSARTPGTIYRASRFVSRHKGGVAATSLIFVLVITVAAMFTAQRVRVAQEKAFAKNREADANAIGAFFEETLTSADPKNPNSRKVTVREAVDVASERALHTYADRPEARGMFLSVLGHVQIALGNYDRAKALLIEAVSILEAPPHSGGLMHAQALGRLGNVEMRRGELVDAANHLNLALAMREELFGASSLSVAETTADLADLAWSNEKPEEARALYLRALDIRQARLPPTDPRIGSLLRDLGDVAWELKDNQGAERYYLDARKNFLGSVGADSLQYGILQNNLGLLYIEEGRWKDARLALDDALRISYSTQGHDHPDLAETFNAIGRVALHDGDLAEAAEMFRNTLRVARFASQKAVRTEAEQGLKEVEQRSAMQH